MVELEKMVETANGFATGGSAFFRAEFVMLIEQALSHLAVSRVVFSDGTTEVYVAGTPQEVAKKIKKGLT